MLYIRCALKVCMVHEAYRSCNFRVTTTAKIKSTSCLVAQRRENKRIVRVNAQKIVSNVMKMILYCILNCTSTEYTPQTYWTDVIHCCIPCIPQYVGNMAHIIMKYAVFSGWKISKWQKSYNASHAQ